MEAVYDFYSPIGTNEAEETCTILTQDNEVFAVLGGFLGPFAGTVDPCIVGTNGTMLVGGEIAPDELSQATAPWYDTNPSTDRQTNTLINLLVETGRADSAGVFVISNQAAEGDAADVEAALNDAGVSVLETAVLDAPDGDQPAQDSIMEVITQRIQSSGANTVFINGNPSAIIRGLQHAGMESSLAIWSNDSAGLANLGESVDLDRAAGVITSDGPTDIEYFATEGLQACVAIVEAATGVTVTDPAAIEVDAENWFNSVRRYCRLLSLFEQLVTAAGVNPTYESVVEAANSEAFDDFALPGIPNNSISPDKPDAQDMFRLSEYDPNISDGGLTAVTELIDIFP